MAGVKNNTRNGKYRGWYYNYQGKQKWFTGTKSKSETKKIANKLEDENRSIKLGYKPLPSLSQKLSSKLIQSVINEYLEWGSSQGGIRGYPWSEKHFKMRSYHLLHWKKYLNLKYLSDLSEIFPMVENQIRSLLKSGKSRKTINNYLEAIKSFCNWCLQRSFISKNPLDKLRGLNTSPKTIRRALSYSEINSLLDCCRDDKKLLYLMALTTGLRANELRSLKTCHFDPNLCGIHLQSAWTKNRKDSFHPLPKFLINPLQLFISSHEALKLYRKNFSKNDSKLTYPDTPLLYVPTNMARELYRDLKIAKIEKSNSLGKVDFHSLRVTYVTLICEMGASVKEAQQLARHSNPSLTMNTYAKSKEERLHQLTDKLGSSILENHKQALSKPETVSDSHKKEVKPLYNKNLDKMLRAGFEPARDYSH